MDPVWHARELGGISTSNNSQFVNLTPSTINCATFLTFFFSNSANWVNHPQPLYIAGRTFASNRRNEPSARSEANDSGRGSGWSPGMDFMVGGAGDGGSTGLEEFAEEKVALLKHLSVIQQRTGWKTWDRARDLRVLWGLEF